MTIPAYRYSQALRTSTIAAVITGANEIAALMGYFQEISSKIAP